MTQLGEMWVAACASGVENAWRGDVPRRLARRSVWVPVEDMQMSIGVYRRTDVALSLRPASHLAVGLEVHSKDLEVRPGENTRKFSRPGGETYAFSETAGRAALLRGFYPPFFGRLPGRRRYGGLRKSFYFPGANGNGYRETFSAPLSR